MTSMFTRLRGRRRITATTILGLVLVPLTVAGLLLWGLWNPTDRLEQVTAAVVNDDEPVEIDGQLAPLGRLLAGELIAGDAETNFTWVLTDAEDASEGLDEGRYASVVTIPENFSSAATSLSRDASDPETATIDIATGDRGRLIDTALSNIVTETATGLLNRQLGEQFVSGVFVGMNELGDGVGEAADGATRLADGGAQLRDGASQLADGTSQLSTGVGELSAGATQLSSGTGELSTGAGTLATGSSELSTGVSAYVTGAGTLASSYAPLSAGATAAAQQLKTTIGALAQLQTDAAEPQTQLGGGLATAGAGAQSLAESIEPLVTQCYASGASTEFCQQLQESLATQATMIGDGVQTAATGAEGLGTAMATFGETVAGETPPEPGVDPVQQLDELIAGLAEFGTGLSGFVEQGAALTQGAAELSDGASQLSAGVSELSVGASQLSTGVSTLAEKTPELAEGAQGLADGAASAADGAGDLADGLDEAAGQIPNYTEQERDRIAQTAVQPVEARGLTGELFNASGVPLFAGIALWAGALAAFLVLAPLWERTRQAARGVGWITLRSALPAIGLGAVQGAIAGIALPIALDYDLGQAARFFGLALVAGIAFALLVQGLSALLGGLGRFVAFVLLVVAFAVGIVSTVPGPLAALGDASPVGAALSGFQSVAAGASGAGSAVALLVLWGLGGLLLTALAVRRARARAV